MAAAGGRGPVASVRIATTDPAILAMWGAVHELAGELPAEHWVLVGGLMVQLHALRYGGGRLRATHDIDLLADGRVRPSATEKTADVLMAAGFAPEEPQGAFEPLLVHRFTRDGVVVDVMGPDGMAAGRGPVATPPHETFAVAGGTQALQRAELVEVLIPGRHPVVVPSPSLAGALVLKARSGVKPNRAKDHEDLVVLLSCVEDPFGLREELTAKERQRLRAVRAVLPQDLAGFASLVGADRADRAERAQQTLTLICAGA